MAGLPTYADSLVIIINTYGYGGNINHTKFFKSLEQSKQLFKLKFDKEVDSKHPVLNKKVRTDRFTRPLSSPR